MVVFWFLGFVFFVGLFFCFFVKIVLLKMLRFFNFSRLFFCLLLFVCCLEGSAPSFLRGQLGSGRVRSAKLAADGYWKGVFEGKLLDYPPDNIYLRVFKGEDVLEVWCSGSGGVYELVKTYDVCSMAGVLGPKRRQGDFQVPEGFYSIVRFNPYSSYYLSLGIDYPNLSDRALGGSGDLGGDIYIHGDCVSDGCLAMRDGPIKELYWLCVRAKDNGVGSIPVHIFPVKLSLFKYNILRRLYGDSPRLLDFWGNLKEGYDFFGEHKRPPLVSVGKGGRYVFR